MTDLIQSLNAKTRTERLDALYKIKKLTDAGDMPKPVMTQYVNNHIHTSYSFSPYSPTMAVYMAWQNGLPTAGIMDHDSVSGAFEFIDAGDIVSVATTVGIECRVNVKNTPFGNRKINNPDQTGVIYSSLHGIPHQYIDMVNNYFEPFRLHRNLRNKAMCEKITDLVRPYGLSLDLEQDVLPLSMHHEGGGVTERHVLFALTKKITAKYTTAQEVVNFLTNTLGMNLSEKVQSTILTSPANFYEYDILGALKAELVEKIYVDAIDECPEVHELIKLARATQSIATYPYLGDVGDSVTGDKKAQLFEDSFLDLVIEQLKAIGFSAIAFMPTRNTQAQLERVMGYCQREGFFQISGEDINSPRQGFICKALDNPAYAHLIDATWALIGHEIAATKNRDDSFISEKTNEQFPDLQRRIEHFESISK